MNAAVTIHSKGNTLDGEIHRVSSSNSPSLDCSSRGPSSVPKFILVWKIVYGKIAAPYPHGFLVMSDKHIIADDIFEAIKTGYAQRPESLRDFPIVQVTLADVAETTSLLSKGVRY